MTIILYGYPHDYNSIGVPSWLLHSGRHSPHGYDIMGDPQEKEINGVPFWLW